MVIDPDMPLDEICTLPDGSRLYRQDNKAGGFGYFTDEFGAMVLVWDSCLVNESTLLAAIVENDRVTRSKAMIEARAKYLKDIKPCQPAKTTHTKSAKPRRSKASARPVKRKKSKPGPHPR